jgi:hypothetical protein
VLDRVNGSVVERNRGSTVRPVKVVDENGEVEMQEVIIPTRIIDDDGKAQPDEQIRSPAVAGNQGAGTAGAAAADDGELAVVAVASAGAGLGITSKKSIYGTPQTTKNFDANIPRLCFFTFVIGMGNIQTGFAISGNNQTAPVIKAKFGWDKDEAVLYNTIISASAIFGIVTGSLLGGKFIPFGRRLCLIVFNVFSALAVTMTMFENLPMICVGRYFYGLCCGVFSVAGPKMLDETVPIHLNSSFGTATNTFLSGGIMLAIVLGLLLPDGADI